MRKTILITTALLASTALAAAQGMGQSAPQGGKEGATPAPSVQRSAPAEKMDKRGAQTKPAETSGQAQKAGEANQPSKAASDSKPADSKAMPNRADTQKPMDNKADVNKTADDKSKADATKAASDNKSATERSSTSTSTDTRTTTGQGAAGSRAKANLTTEQKTTVRTVIREKIKAQPLTNVTFSVNVGTRVPRDVQYYPVPAELVTIYPAWRGYHFILVNDQIVIIDPSTFEIVEIIV
jgi:hypothetical protein